MARAAANDEDLFGSALTLEEDHIHEGYEQGLRRAAETPQLVPLAPGPKPCPPPHPARPPPHRGPSLPALDPPAMQGWPCHGAPGGPCPGPAEGV